MDDEKQALRKILITHWKWIINLQASDRAIQRILAELMPHLSKEAEKVILKYPEFLAEERENLLLSFEKKQPGLAAELDADEDNDLEPPKL